MAWNESPSADLHHYSRVELLLHEQSLREASTKIVGADLAEVLVAGLLHGSLGGALHRCTNATFRQLDERVLRRDVFGWLELADVAFDATREERIARLAFAVGSVLALGYPKPVLVALLFDVLGLNLGNLECTQADIPTDLDDDVVALANQRRLGSTDE